MPKKAGAGKAGLPKVGVLDCHDAVPAGATVLWRPVFCPIHHFDPEPCNCYPPGPQILALTTDADEIFYGGSRGGMKTETGRAFLIKGNIDVPADKKKPVDISYINHPRYRALVLRKNQIDLADWVDRAKAMYRPLGGELKSQPERFEFGSGAKIYLGHMADEEAYEKYQGQEFHRMVIEELTQIPSALLYLRIKASCRSTIPELKRQIFITANPGGIGAGWVKSRFIKMIGQDGKPVPPNTKYADPMEEGATRIFIPARLKDNPYLTRDDTYRRDLMALPEAQRRAWLDGDWDALSGQFFTEFRPKGPLESEKNLYPWANHVIPAESVDLKPWWPRWIACDWGFEHDTAVYWGCEADNGQIHVYREYVTNNTLISDLGAEIARRSLEDLRGLERHQMTLWLSHELFSHDGQEKTRAEQMKWAIEKVLGPDSVAVLSLEEEKALDSAEEQDFFAVREFQRRANITIRRAKTDRIAGYQFIRELMRFKPTVRPAKEAFNYQYALELAMKDQLLYFKYMAAFQDAEQKAEVLPKLQIWDCCRVLTEIIPEATYDEKRPEEITVKHFKHKDAIDGFRYLAMAYKHEQSRAPKNVYVAEQIAAREHQNLDWNQRVQIAEHFTREYDKAASQTGFNIPRASSRRAHVTTVN